MSAAAVATEKKKAPTTDRSRAFDAKTAVLGPCVKSAKHISIGGAHWALHHQEEEYQGTFACIQAAYEFGKYTMCNRTKTNTSTGGLSDARGKALKMLSADGTHKVGSLAEHAGSKRVMENAVQVKLNLTEWHRFRAAVMKIAVTARARADPVYAEKLKEASRGHFTWLYLEPKRGRKSVFWGGSFKKGEYQGPNELGRIMREVGDDLVGASSGSAAAR